MSENKTTAGVLNLIDGAGKAWILAAGIVALIGWGYSVENKVDNDHLTILTMLSRDLPNKFQNMSDKQVNDESSYSDIKGQLAAIQAKVDQTNSALNMMGQDVAVLKSKASFYQNPASYPQEPSK